MLAFVYTASIWSCAHSPFEVFFLLFFLFLCKINVYAFLYASHGHSCDVNVSIFQSFCINVYHNQIFFVARVVGAFTDKNCFMEKSTFEGVIWEAGEHKKLSAKEQNLHTKKNEYISKILEFIQSVDMDQTILFDHQRPFIAWMRSYMRWVELLFVVVYKRMILFFLFLVNLTYA